MNKDLKLFDSLTKNLISVFSNSKELVSLYVCGITPYDDAHAGHGRCYIVYDILIRFLRWQRQNICYVRNITDIDDKIISKATTLYNNPERFNEISQKYYKKFLSELNRLNCLRPDSEPKATEAIDSIITLIQKLLDNHNAYICNDGVYFNIASYKSYGQLSKRNLDEQCPGARVDIRCTKQNSCDFALWKLYNNGPLWDSPWGKGRPGWHIECSAMIHDTLENQVTIHGGGSDLLFPHHENERAQSESITKIPLSEIWMHTAFVTLKEDKMSKSLGNVITLESIIANYNPMAFRLYVLNNHYRSQLHFSFDALQSFDKMYQKLIKVLTPKDTNNNTSCIQEAKEFIISLEKFLSEDLNTAECIGYIFKHEKNIRSNIALQSAVANFAAQVLGITLDQSIPTKKQENSAIEKLIAEREEARKNRNFKRADELRNTLKELGYEPSDKKL